MCCEKNFLSYILKKICLYSTYSSFLVINVCNQGKTLFSPCIMYSECEYVDFGIQDVTRMRHIVICGLFGSTTFSHAIS